jgi:nitroimidazol reductase NimA-like FMN-containing flavoprotein (pyridoxamine 5'-phosphate oxidase superfamily)
MEPVASRPRVPEEYGVPSDADGLLPWSYVRERMETAEHYWLSTVGTDNGPHTRPVAGMWLDDRLYFGGSEDSRWRRNLRDNPRACVNLSEEGDQAVILHGTVEPLRADRDLATRLAEASNAKYNYGQKPADYEGAEILAFLPETAFAWNVLYEDSTRWRF